LPSKSETPEFWLVAGPNGSGKSAVHQGTNFGEFGRRSIWIINPDALSLRIKEIERLSTTKANLAAVQRIERWIEASIQAHQTIGVETVLSTDKYKRLVKLAKSLNFRVRLIYVVLDSPARNVERVRLRVEKGGHNVPKKKILERYKRSLEQLPWFLAESDEAWIFDNSRALPNLIATKADGEIVLDVELAPRDLADAVKAVSIDQA